MDSTTVKMHLFLDACCEIESICAEIYYFFAEHFIDEPRVSRLWCKTAMEEENHARHVYLAKKMVESISWVSLESWRDASRARDAVRQLAVAVQKSPPSIEDALRLSLQCEERMERFHMQNAMLMKEKGGNDLFRALMREDREHASLLKAALDEQLTQTESAMAFPMGEICPAA